MERLTLEGHIDRVNACAVSPDGRWIMNGDATPGVVVKASAGAKTSLLVLHDSIPQRVSRIMLLFAMVASVALGIYLRRVM